MRLNSGSFVASVMTEPSAIWSTSLQVFDQTLGTTQNVILSQGRFALQALVRRIDYLHEMLKHMPSLKDAYVHPDIPATLTDLCNQQGIASTILFNDGPRQRKESVKAHKLRLERIAYVKHWTKNVPIKILSNRKVRNSLIHIDEYIADAFDKPKTGWLVDSAIGSRTQFTAAQHGIGIDFCRSYIASEDMILHLGNEISVSKLKWEASAILAAVFGESHPGLLSRPAPIPPAPGSRPAQKGA
jgi:hypothetical protein